MCRFILYSGPAVTLSSLLVEPVNSLIHQSFHSYETAEPVNGDGFGIAWYAPKLSSRPGLFRSMSPAWNNQNLKSLARVTESACILAHVRAATPGLVVSESNCHPFVFGRLAFMHNGVIGGFHNVRRALGQSVSNRAYDAIGGATDSEHAFAVLLDEVGFDDAPLSADSLANGIRRTIARIVELVERHGGAQPSYLNFAVTDGTAAAVSRFVSDPQLVPASLHVSEGARYECNGGICRMTAATPGNHAVIISSEPLTADSAWRTVPPNHIVTVDAQRGVAVTPI